jgi:tetratricopeptide (TPR) repeat protein
MDEHRFDEAAETLQQIIDIKPNFALAHGRLGTIHAKRGEAEKAVDSLNAATAFDPDDPYAVSMLGWLAYIGGRSEESLGFYQRALEAEPSSAKIHYQLGLVMARLNRWPDAIASFREALVLEPNHAQVCQGLSHALRRQGESKEALFMAQRSARLTRFEDAYILVTLAEAFIDLNHREDAKTTLAKASQIALANVPQLLPQIRTLQAINHAGSL